MLNIAVFVSGGGTNLQALIDAQDRGEIKNGKITFVLASNEGAYALERAKNAGIDSAVVSPKDFENREAFNQTIESYPNARLVLYGHIHYFTNVLKGHVRYCSSSSVGFAFDKDLPKFQIADGYEGINLIEIINDSITINNIQLSFRSN